MEDTLNLLKALSTLSPRSIQLPNCDRRGFYKKKQVSPRSPAPTRGGGAQLGPPAPPLPPPPSALSRAGQLVGTRPGSRRGSHPLLCFAHSAAQPRAGSAASAGAWTSMGSPSRATTPRAKPTCTVTVRRASDLGVSLGPGLRGGAGGGSEGGQAPLRKEGALPTEHTGPRVSDAALPHREPRTGARGSRGFPCTPDGALVFPLNSLTSKEPVSNIGLFY